MADSENRLSRLRQKSIVISCVIPVYNEYEIISEFLCSLHHKLKELTDSLEIIVVDDGSTDLTAETVIELQKHLPVKLLCLSRNFGKENAITAGLDYSSGDVTILLDADFQHPLELLTVFLEKWAEGYEMVYGVRKSRDNESKFKRASTHFFYQIMHYFSSVEIPTDAGDFRLLDRQVVASLRQLKESNRFMKGLYAWVGFKSLAIPFTVQKRKAGTSSWHFSKLAELALTGITSFSHVPLRIWSLVGLTISALSLSCVVYIIIKTLLYGTKTPGYPSIMVAIAFLGGIQLLSIGILGEYIGRIFTEVKKRPHYLLAKKYDFNDSSEEKISSHDST